MTELMSIPGTSNEPPSELTHHELAEVLRVTLRAGVLMLRSGSASFRTEQVMVRMAAAMGVHNLEAYVTPTVVIASAYSGREHRTQIKKVPVLGVDMNRIVEIEQLSRRLKPSTQPLEIESQLSAIEKMGSQYPRPMIVLAVALACGAFALILGAGLLEAFCAFCGAGLAQTLRIRMARAGFNPIPITVLCAALATAVSYGLSAPAAQVAAALGLVFKARLGIIASVLLLVPGVPLVTSILDLTRIDLVSGTARGMFALILFICIGIGMLLILAWTQLSII